MSSTEKRSTNAVAGLCSFLFPGLGQLVTGRIGAALIWFLITFIGYFFFVVPGIILHIVCIVDAANEGNY
jgi:TM2 domain-containing membrane protein YozV